MLVFDPARLPRTMTRPEWRDLHRWRRLTERQIAGANADRLEAAMAISATRPDIAASIVAGIVNPPIVVVP